MTGMDTMSSAMKPLSQVPWFTGLFTMFTNPVLGLLVGALITAVIQSSSASVGILQALCATGSINYAAAVPIILGQNIWHVCNSNDVGCWGKQKCAAGFYCSLTF